MIYKGWQVTVQTSGLKFYGRAKRDDKVLVTREFYGQGAKEQAKREGKRLVDTQATERKDMSE